MSGKHFCCHLFSGIRDKYRRVPAKEMKEILMFFSAEKTLSAPGSFFPV
jgi:hypothetical protein